MALPSGYKRLEYIRCNGTQYADLGFAPNQNTRVVIDCQASALDSGGTFPFGCRTAYNSQAFAAALVPGQVFYNYATTHQFVDYADPYERMTIDANKNVATFTGSETVTITLASGTFTVPSNLLVGSASNGGTPYTGAYAWTGDIWSVRVYDNGTLIRDVIMCETDTGEVGLWDNVNNVFYGSSGTNAFIAGPEYDPTAPVGDHNTLIGGVAREIEGLNVLLGGVSNEVENGIVLSDGVAREIEFISEPVSVPGTITITGSYSIYSGNSVSVNGTELTNTGSYDITVPAEITVIAVSFVSTARSSIMLNGVRVVNGAYGGNAIYTFTTDSANITVLYTSSVSAGGLVYSVAITTS